jgi:hypothetical protein
MLDGRAAPTVAVDVALFTVIEACSTSFGTGATARSGRGAPGKAGVDSRLDAAAAPPRARRRHRGYLEQRYLRQPETRSAGPHRVGRPLRPVLYGGEPAENGRRPRRVGGTPHGHFFARHRPAARLRHGGGADRGRAAARQAHRQTSSTLPPRASTLGERRKCTGHPRPTARPAELPKILSLGLLRPLGLRRGLHRRRRLHAFRHRRPMVVEIL